MKYIRTKDGIYEINNDVYIENDEAFMRWFSNGKEIEPDSLGKVINQADTIEELCDEFVAEELFVETNYIAHINKSVGVEKNLDYFVNYFIESNKVTKDKLLNVYGAIWTDKGLIYVAKLNEKGEFELI